MKQTNIEKLIEWMEEEGSDFLTVDTILMKAKQLQQEEPRMYTQEEMDKACKDAYERAIKFYGVPPIPMSVKDENITGKR